MSLGKIILQSQLIYARNKNSKSTLVAGKNYISKKQTKKNPTKKQNKKQNTCQLLKSNKALD